LSQYLLRYIVTICLLWTVTPRHDAEMNDGEVTHFVAGGQSVNINYVTCWLHYVRNSMF